MRLDDVAAVEEGHGSVFLDPNLVTGVLGDNGKGCDVQAKLARLGKLAYEIWRLAREYCDSCKGNNIPRQVPRDRILSRAIEVARLAIERRT
jgi:hypothetical protein